MKLLALLIAVVFVVGVLVEVPKLRTAHINQLPERRRRESAARRTLGLWMAAAAVLAYAVWRLIG